MSHNLEFLKLYRRPSYLLETRVVLDFIKMLGKLTVTALKPRTQRSENPIIVAPGFGADDRFMWPLRTYLKLLGYNPHEWGLGRNLAGIDIKHTPNDVPPGWIEGFPEDYRGEASVAMLCERLRVRVAEKHQETGLPVTLVGWSLGGYLVREVARELPDAVDKVVTMGSPVVGGPKYTAAAKFFKKRGQDLDWVEKEIAGRERTPITQPITAIYSQSDAVVSWPAAIDRWSENVEHVRVESSHLGMIFNPTVWNRVASALQ